MLLIKDWNLRKIIFAIICAIAIFIIALFAINKIRTVPMPETPYGPSVAIKPTLPGQTLVAEEIPVKEEYPKQVIVGLKSWSDVESAKKIITDNGGKIISVLDWPTKKVIIAVLPDKNSEEGILKNSFWGKLAGGIGLSSFGNKLSGGIDNLAKDEIAPLPEITADALTQQFISWGVERIRANKIWSLSTGKNVKVAILDTGVQRNHPDLIANIKGGVSFTPNSSPDQWGDDSGHGTGVAGAIAAVNNNIGSIGVAPEASLYIVKDNTIGGNNAILSSVISGIYWSVENGMDVINMSTRFDAPNADLEEAVDYAYASGIVIVASAGNLGGGDGRMIYPALYSNSVIAVGATVLDNSIAYFSSHGPAVELAAPGSYLLTTAIGSSYETISGTSIAAPFVSGVAALLLSANPEMTPEQVRQRLDSTAVDLGSPGRDEYFGYGLVNAHDALLPPVLPVTFNLISPKGGDVWLAGAGQEVLWSVANVPSDQKLDKVDIQLINENTGSVYQILPDTPNTGRALLNVPISLPIADTDSYFLQISCEKLFMGKCQPAKSGLLKFTVAPPQALKIISPNKGEQWPQGTTQTVSWSANYFGRPNIDITLLEKKKIPVYSFVSNILSLNSDSYTCFDPLSCPAWAGGFSAYDPNGLWQDSIHADGYPVKAGEVKHAPPPSDTCDGKNDRSFCPATYSSDHLTCIDVSTIENLIKGIKLSFARTVDCSYKQGSQTNTCFNPSSCYSWLGGWTMYDPNRYWAAGDASGEALVSSPPSDTCDGSGGRFYCPTTYSSASFTCTDVDTGTHSNPKYGTYYWLARTVNCSYVSEQTGWKDVIEPVKNLAENIVNGGLAEMDIPDDLIGNNYYVQLSCANYTGECAEGLSSGPFSIIRLADPVTLTINKLGDGTITDGNTTCSGNTCLKSYERGTTVTLEPLKSTNSMLIFSGWSDNSACTGTEPCQITMDGDQSVTATFSERSVTLTAVADPGSVFINWSGECLDKGECLVSWSGDCVGDVMCNITVNKDQSVMANFIKNPILQVNKLGGGTGTVIGEQINCGADCSSTYVLGDSETLSAQAGPESVFAGWFGLCTGTGICSVVMDGDKSVTAIFNSTNINLRFLNINPDSGESIIPLKPYKIKEVMP